MTLRRKVRDLAICVLTGLMLGSCGKSEEPRIIDTLAIGIDSLPRSSITFILGKDENLRNPYYQLASYYYRLSEEERTEIVVDTIATISGVLDYLARNRPSNGHPWGLINLVSHGNEFVDLSVAVTPHGPRANEETLQEAIEDSSLRRLDSSIVDRQTTIHLHGCAVGKNRALLSKLGAAFGGDRPPRVKASKLFEYYSNTSPNRNPQQTRHYYARVWYAFYRPDAMPSNALLAADYKSRFPNDSINWEEALLRTHPDDPGEEYHTRFFVPISLEELYQAPELVPDVRSVSKQERWIDEHPAFQALVTKSSIPWEYFQTKFYRNVYSGESATVYGLRAKARAGVVCVIKPVLGGSHADGDRFRPFVPAATDTAYFGFGE